MFDLIHKEFPGILNDTDHELNVNYDNFEKNIKSRQQGSKPRRVLQLLHRNKKTHLENTQLLLSVSLFVPSITMSLSTVTERAKFI